MVLTSWLASLKSAFPVSSRHRQHPRQRVASASLASLQALETRILLSVTNDTPAAQTFNINVTEDLGPQLITLAGDDGDPEFIQQLTYAIASNPAHGTLSSFNATAGTVLYTPASNYVGPDSFTYTVADDGATVLSLQGVVSGNIATPGQSDLFSFSLATDTQVYFDALGGANNLEWTLQGPGISLTRSFTFSDADFTSDTILRLRPGSYTLKMAGIGEGTDAYQFALRDVTTKTPMTLGTPVSGTLNPGNESKFYSFEGTAGDTLYFDSSPLTGTAIQSNWRVLDPSGQTVNSRSLNNGDFGPVTLTATGTYTVIVEGYITEGAKIANYQFNIFQLNDPPPQPLTLNTLVTGNLVTTVNADTYTFTLAAPAKLYFDSLPTDSSLQVTFTGPAGTVYRSFSSDMAAPVINAPAGPYTMKLQRSSPSAGPYQFRLVDLASATPLTIGTPVSSTLNPLQETDLYKFEAVAGNRFNFDSQSLTGITVARWRLIDPFGLDVPGTINVSLATDMNAIVAQYSGTYTLLIEGANFVAGPPGSYTFNVTQTSDVAIPPVTGTDYTLNTAQNGVLLTNSQIDDYKFTLPAEALVYMDGQTSDTAVKWTLVGPSGTFTKTFAASDKTNASPVYRLAAGTYKLSVDGGGFSTPYQFNLRTLASADALTIGTPVSSSLNPISETDLYSFSGNAGDRYFLNTNATTGTTATWRLLDPYGFVMTSFARSINNNDIGTVTLPYTGTYTILVEGNVTDAASSANYTINVTEVPPVPAPIPISIGSVVSGSHDVPGMSSIYTFSVATPSLIYFDAQAGDIKTNLRITGPSGYIEKSFYSVDSLNTLLPLMRFPAGNYTLTIDHSGDGIGPYQFRMIDLSTAAPITLNTATPGNLNPKTETDLFSFNATAGNTYFLNMFPITGAIDSSNWRILTPQGNQLSYGNVAEGDSGPFIATESGTYYLLIEGNLNQGGAGTSGTYGFNLSQVTNLPTQALTLGTFYSGSLPNPGNTDTYTFNLASKSNLYFDAIYTNSNVVTYLTLQGPAGTIFNTFGATDGGVSDPVLKLLPAGQYTLTISHYMDQVGPYQFRLLNLSSGTPLTPGNQVNGILSPTSETDAYSFNATAGNQFTFDGISLTGDSSLVYWRLVDPYGATIAGPNLFPNDFGPITIQYSGTYALLIDGVFNNNGSSSNYSFNVIQNPNVAIPPVGGTPINLDTTQSGFLALSSQVDDYQFTLAADTLIAVDILTNDSSLKWTLNGPVKFGPQFFNFTDGSYNNDILNLPAGTYKFSVTTTSVSGGNYQFNLRSLSAAPALTLGNLVSASLNPANETDLYKFTGNVGDKFYIDGDPPSSSLLFAKAAIIDPFGRIVNTNSSSLLGTSVGFTLPATGTYTIVIEGRVDFTTPGDYSFTLYSVNNPSPASLTSAAGTANVTVVNRNDPPQGTNKTITTNEDTDFIFTAATFGFSDPNDTPANTLLGVLFTTVPSPTTAVLSVNGVVVTAGQTVSATDIAAGKLKLTPIANGFGTPLASFTFQVQDNGGTANSGVDLDQSPNTITVNVTSVNDAPVLSATGTPTLTSIAEDTLDASNPGTLVSQILTNFTTSGGTYTDDDLGALKGIAVTSVDNTKGTWQYTTDNGTNWIDFGTPTAAAARLLASVAGTRIRFRPNADYNGPATFQFVAWDQTAGTNGSTGVATNRGGSKPYSSMVKSASLTINPVNDAPLLDNTATGVPTLTAIPRNLSDATNTGTLVSQILTNFTTTGGSFTDVDTGALKGIAVTNVNNTNGTWEYTTDNGSTWSTFGTPTASAARLLASSAGTKMRFRPNANFSGSATFLFVAWDQSTGTNGSTAVVTSRGGTKAFSLGSDTGSISVFIANNAPVLNTNGNPTLTSITKNIPDAGNNGTLVSTIITNLTATGGSITDPDAGALQGIAVTSANNANGTWQYSINNGTTWTDFGTPAAATARLLASDANTRIRFKPNANYTGTATFLFVAWDQSAGVNGGTLSATTRGNATPFSTGYDTATISITP